jgi:predicted DNA binding CopG/RHH family protein
MKRSKLEKLSSREIEDITRAANKRKNVPLVRSKQVNMRLDGHHLEQGKLLAAAQGIPYTTFLTRLLREDIDRLWKVFKGSSK